MPVISEGRIRYPEFRDRLVGMGFNAETVEGDD